MKKLLLIAFGALLLGGCISATKQQSQEMDIVGIEATTPDILNIGTATKVAFGIIHERSWSNPTSTNLVYAAPMAIHTVADLGALSQTVSNTVDAGK